MEIGIGYLPVRLRSRLAITQNEVKTSPALVTAQIPISEPFVVSFKPDFNTPKLLPFWPSGPYNSKTCSLRVPK